MTENPWKHVRPRSTAGGIRKMQAKEISALESEWTANSKRTLEENKAAAERTIAAYNEQLKRRDMDIIWSPLLIAATLSSHTWLHVHCPGCNTVAAVDLTIVPRPATTAITSIAEKLRCERCRGQAAAPRIVRLSSSHEG